MDQKYQDAVRKALGDLTIRWAEYEFQLFMLFVYLVDVGDIQNARIVWYNSPSMQSKLKMMKKMLQLEEAHEFVEEAKGALKTAEQLNTSRNEYVHGMYIGSNDKTKFLLRWFRDNNYRETQRIVEPEAVEAFVKKLTGATAALKKTLTSENKRREAASGEEEDDQQPKG